MRLVYFQHVFLLGFHNLACLSMQLLVSVQHMDLDSQRHQEIVSFLAPFTAWVWITFPAIRLLLDFWFEASTQTDWEMLVLALFHHSVTMWPFISDRCQALHKWGFFGSCLPQVPCNNGDRDLKITRPCGILWGLLFSYLEAAKNTEDYPEGRKGRRNHMHFHSAISPSMMFSTLSIYQIWTFSSNIFLIKHHT